jgi:hypothetical protein
VAADATCARLMGLEPDRIAHIREGSKFFGNSCLKLADQVGETIAPPTTPFQVLPEFQYLRLAWQNDLMTEDSNLILRPGHRDVMLLQRKCKRKHMVATLNPQPAWLRHLISKFSGGSAFATNRTSHASATMYAMPCSYHWGSTSEWSVNPDNLVKGKNVRESDLFYLRWTAVEITAHGDFSHRTALVKLQSWGVADLPSIPISEILGWSMAMPINTTSG